MLTDYLFVMRNPDAPENFNQSQFVSQLVFIIKSDSNSPHLLLSPRAVSRKYNTINYEYIL